MSRATVSLNYSSSSKHQPQTTSFHDKQLHGNLVFLPPSLIPSGVRQKEKHGYLHRQSGGLLVVVVEEVGHEGGVVGEILAHSEADRLAGEHAVTAHRIHVDAQAAREQGQNQQSTNEPHPSQSYIHNVPHT